MAKAYFAETNGPKSIDQEVGSQLSRLIAARGCNIASICDSSLIGEQDLRDFVSGDRRIPPSTVRKLAKSLDVSITFFLWLPQLLPVSTTHSQTLDNSATTKHRNQ